MLLQVNIEKALPLLLIVTAALCIILSLPSFDLGIFAWFGLSPFLFALRKRGLRGAAGLGFLFGLLFTLGTFSWLSSVSAVGLWRFVFLIAPVIALYYFVFGLLYGLVSRHVGSWIILGAPALWVALEYVRSNFFFLSCPWNLLGHSQYRYLPVIQIADITGVYGISFLIVMVNQFLSEVPDLFTRRKAIRSKENAVFSHTIRWAAHTAALALVLAVVFSYGWYRLATADSGARIRTALVQANVVARDNMAVVEQKQHLEPYEQLTREAAEAEPELIVWPASSLPAPIKISRLVRYSVKQLARETRAYLLVGGAGVDKMLPQKKGYLPYSNTEFLIAPSGRVVKQYNKRMLLPFNEYLPLQGKIPWPRWISPLEESFIPGREYTLFQVKDARFGAPICWENMFPGFFRQFVKEGANLMVSVTNEAFYGRTAGPYQSLITNIFRAVENRVAIVRSAPTGVSAFISADGEILEKIMDGNGNDLFVPGILTRDVLLSNKKSFYTAYGDIFAYVAIGIAIVMILISLYAQKLTTRYRVRD